MTDSLILYTGMFCFAMMALGIALTIAEFKRMKP